MVVRYIKVALVALGIGALSLPVSAQNAPQTGAAADELQEITVTGSRVIMNGNDAPTPVTVVNLQQMQATKPTTVFEQLAELPAFNDSGGATATQPTIGIGVGSSGVAGLNLRGLGENRDLVLFDGHRVPPSTVDGIVDINLLPQMLMQRVDIVTGGASAMYGSDAVSGVINFILDRKFNGLKVDVQAGQSGHHDDRSYQVGIAGGTDLFGGRGHVEASFQRNSDDGLANYLTRPALFDWTLEGDGAPVDPSTGQRAGTPYHLVQGTTATNQAYGGLVRNFHCWPLDAPPPCTPPNDNYVFAQNGVLTPFVKGPTDGLNPNHMLGGGGAINDVVALKSKTRQDQFFARVDYDLNDNLHAWANVGASVDYNYALSNPSLTFFVTFSGCNPYLTTAQQQSFGCTDPTNIQQQTDTAFKLNKYPDPRTNAVKATISSLYLRNYNFMGGLEGKFAGTFRWDATYTFSETKENTRADGVDEDPHWFAAIDAVTDPATGQIVCRVTLINPTLMPGCSPMDMFGPSAESQASAKYAFGRLQYWSETRLNGLAGNIHGEPLNDWAGPIGVALSGEARRQSLELHANSYADPVDCSFDIVLGNCDPVNTHTWGNWFAPMPEARQDATEAAFELDVPMLKDAPFAKMVHVDSAVRYTRYQNNGNNLSSSINATTWKFGPVWDVNDQLTLRASRSRDIRAPNLWDLFSPIVLSNASFGTSDLLTNNDASQLAPIQSGGNAKLKPEVALTTTVGLIWHPTSAFNMAVDGYFINLKDGIATVYGGDVAVQKICYASLGASPYCALQPRALGLYDPSNPSATCVNTNPTCGNLPTRWIQQGINIGRIKISGIDFESNYNTRLADRAFSMRALVAYKPHTIYSQAGLKTIDDAGAAAYNGGYGNLGANPVWRASLFANYAVTSNFSVDVSEGWRSHMNFQADRDLLEVGGGVAAFYTTNLTLTYTIPRDRGNLAAYLNIQNLFDKSPPIAGSQGGPGDPGGYANGDDPVGRYFILGLRARL